MTLFMDAARAAFNSSYTINSVKRNIARFCPMDHDRKLFFLRISLEILKLLIYSIKIYILLVEALKLMF